MALLEAIQHEFDTARNPQFFEDPKQIISHGVLAQFEMPRNFPVGHAFGYQARDIFFALRQQIAAACILQAYRRDLAQSFQQET